MLEIGKYNVLEVARLVDFGLYLTDAAPTDPAEILLPARYVPDGTNIGDKIKVFVYTDSEDRLIATTEQPYATVGEFAFLQVKDVNATGAFLDWGLAKDLLVPYSQQRSRMRQGGIYLVYVYLDNASGRVVATAKIDKYLGNVIPRYKTGQKVDCLIYEHTPIGYKAIVNNLHKGMIYADELTHPLTIGQSIIARVKHVRDDGKIDLDAGAGADERTATLSAKIMRQLETEGVIALGDKSAPDQIKAILGCSKKDFKKALGYLYKQRKIVIEDLSVRLV